MKSGVYLWDGVVEDDAFLGPACIFTNDAHPRSRASRPYETRRVGRGASIGASAVILPGLPIDAGAMVGIAAVITKSVPADETWRGNSARAYRQESTS